MTIALNNVYQIIYLYKSKKKKKKFIFSKKIFNLIKNLFNFFLFHLIDHKRTKQNEGDTVYRKKNDCVYRVYIYTVYSKYNNKPYTVYQYTIYIYNCKFTSFSFSVSQSRVYVCLYVFCFFFLFLFLNCNILTD